MACETSQDISSQPAEGLIAAQNEGGSGEVAKPSLGNVLAARAAIGVVVLICAEVFSGASLKLGLWHPLTLLVTYWLYFAHFFFFATLAVRFRRTSLPSLYLWGVLYGLYESWITKVIWYGYAGDGKFILGPIGPFGFAEISMVFLFHPAMSFILPLAIACLLCPPVLQLFPELAWITGKGKWGRGVRIYLIVSFAPVMAMNCGGPLNLLANVAVATSCLFLLLRWARPALAGTDGRDILVFGRRGFAGLCGYLALLYGVTYAVMRPDGLPSATVQLCTLAFYAVPIVALWYHRATEPGPAFDNRAIAEEWRTVRWFCAVVFGLALVLSTIGQTAILYVPIAVNFVLWTLLGFVLTISAIVAGIRWPKPSQG